jgi:hypothetical protein
VRYPACAAARTRPTAICVFPVPGRTDEQNIGRGLEVAAGRELVDQVAVDAGGGVVVEPVQRGGGGQGREPQSTGQAPRFGGVDLDGEEPFERRGHRQALGDRGVQHGGQRLGGVVELEDREVGAQLLVEARLGGR